MLYLKLTDIPTRSKNLNTADGLKGKGIVSYKNEIKYIFHLLRFLGFYTQLNFMVKKSPEFKKYPREFFRDGIMI
jgi:hypothetical protein